MQLAFYEYSVDGIKSYIKWHEREIAFMKTNGLKLAKKMKMASIHNPGQYCWCDSQVKSLERKIKKYENNIQQAKMILENEFQVKF